MKHVKPLILNEELFNVRDLDYVDSISELFQVFSYLKQRNSIDRDGNLKESIEEINEELDKSMGTEEYFEDEEDYMNQLNVIVDIIKNYRYKL